MQRLENLSKMATSPIIVDEVRQMITHNCGVVAWSAQEHVSVSSVRNVRSLQRKNAHQPRQDCLSGRDLQGFEAGRPGVPHGKLRSEEGTPADPYRNTRNLSEPIAQCANTVCLHKHIKQHVLCSCGPDWAIMFSHSDCGKDMRESWPREAQAQVYILSPEKFPIWQ